MKTKLCALLLTILLLAGLVACGSEDPKSPNGGTESSVPATSDPTASGGSTVVSGDTEDEGGNAPTADPQLMAQARYLCGNRTGYAWIEADRSHLLVSAKDGSTVLKLEKPYKPVSNFYNGYALITAGDRSESILINLKGEHLFSAESLGVTGIVVYGRKVSGAFSATYEDTLENGFLEAGYLLVYNIHESYSGVSYEMGVVDLAGNWVQPMSSEHPILTTQVKGKSFSPSATAFSCEILYAGENKVVFKADPWGSYGIYDLSTNKVTGTVYYDDVHVDYGNFNTSGIEFRNGYIAYTCKPGMVAYYEKVDANGNISGFNSNNNFVGSRYFNGYDTYCPIFDDGYFSIDTKNAVYVWTRDGKNTCNYSEYKTSYTYGEFIDGRAPLIIGNAEGSKYYTVVNTAGDFQFEPIKIDNFSYLLFDSEYVAIRTTESNINGSRYLFYTLSGEYIGERYGSIDGLSGGVIRVKGYDSSSYYLVEEVANG